MESYWLVSDLVIHGKSVYAETARYNYGPIWQLILGVCRRITIAFNIDDIEHFHIIIAGCLTWVDAMLALILRKHYGARAALFFFLNPVSILITGYHSQFDNFAILLAMMACSQMNEDNKKFVFRSTILSMSLLGVSLAVKHIFIFFPLWLWWKYRNASVELRSSILVFAYGIFGLLFVPFIFDPDSLTGIVENVLKYGSSYRNGLLGRFLALFFDVDLVESHLGVSLSGAMFKLLTIVAGVLWTSRCWDRSEMRELLFIYLITIVALTCSMADQYLAIPIVALARYYRRVASWVYSLTATVLLFASSNNVFGNKFSNMRAIEYHSTQILLLILLAMIWKQRRELNIHSEVTDSPIGQNR